MIQTCYNSELEDYDFKSLMDMHMMLGRGRLPNIFVHSAIAYINWPVYIYSIHVLILFKLMNLNFDEVNIKSMINYF